MIVMTGHDMTDETLAYYNFVLKLSEKSKGLGEEELLTKVL